MPRELRFLRPHYVLDFTRRDKVEIRAGFHQADIEKIDKYFDLGGNGKLLQAKLESLGKKDWARSVLFTEKERREISLYPVSIFDGKAVFCSEQFHLLRQHARENGIGMRDAWDKLFELQANQKYKHQMEQLIQALSKKNNAEVQMNAIGMMSSAQFFQQKLKVAVSPKPQNSHRQQFGMVNSGR